MFRRFIAAVVLGAASAVGGLIARDMYGPIKNKICAKVKNSKKMGF